MTEIVLFGVFSEIIELCERKNLKIAFGVDPKIDQSEVNFTIFKTEKKLLEFLGTAERNYSYIVVPDMPSIREKIVNFVKDKISISSFYTLIDDGVMLSPTASIGFGSIIMFGSLVSSNSVIGNFVKMNFFARVHHDVVVEDFCTIAPGATLLGGVHIGKGAYIGANATVLPGITIGEWATVGAGAVVTRDIRACKTVKGVPAK